jgi:hypothetical protein
MNKITQLVPTLLALSLYANANAEGIGKYVLTPDPTNEVEEISTIKIDFPDTGWAGIANPNLSNVTLICDENPSLKYTVATSSYSWGSDVTMSFKLDGSSSFDEVTISTPGHYTLTIPEGTIANYFDSSKTNDEIVVTYVIPTPAETSMSAYTLNPSSTEATSLSEITITFPNATGGLNINGDASSVVLKKKTGKQATYTASTIETTGSNSAIIKFASSIVLPGDYSLSIPANLFSSNDAPSDKNLRIDVDYTIAKNYEGTTLTNYTVTPEIGVIDELSTFSISFPYLEDGLSWPITTDDIKLTAVVGDSSTEYHAINITASNNISTLSMSFAEADSNLPVTFTEAGTYTIELPAGILSDYTDTSVTNEKIELTYTIKAASTLSNYTITPEANSTVGHIDNVSLTFQNAPEGLAWPFNTDGIILSNTTTGSKYIVTTATLGGDGYRTANLKFNQSGTDNSNWIDITEGGIYKLTIPSGAFKDYSNAEFENPTIDVNFTIDPSINFNYTINPTTESKMTTLSTIEVCGANPLTNIRVKSDAKTAATLSCGENTITLISSQKDNNTVVFSTSDGNSVSFGEWTLNIPAGLLEGDGLSTVISNPTNITAIYTVKEAEKYEYTLSPNNDETISLFKRFTVDFTESKPYKVSIDETAGTPVLVGKETYELKGSVSSKVVELKLTSGSALPDGEYTISIPAGYIRTIDTDKLEASVDAITSKFELAQPTVDYCSDGIYFVNEGWYGHDCGSINYLDRKSNTLIQDIFALQNPNKSLGTTSQYAELFGDKLFIVSKQQGSNANGGIISILNANTLELLGEVYEVGGKTSGVNSICGVSAEKAYIGSDTGIYILNLSDYTVSGPIKNTEIQSSSILKYKYGEMVRHGKYVFAVENYGGLLVIDYNTDNLVANIDMMTAINPIVTADGSLYITNNDDAREFIKVDPETLDTEDVDVVADNKAAVANIWTTWKKAPIACDANNNIAYYARKDESSTIDKYDFDKKEYVSDFITLPVSENGKQQVLYGGGISVDQKTGYIVLTATESGWGTHYAQNWIYFVDPNTGNIIEDKTIRPSDYYWFPAMAVYSIESTPEIELNDIDIKTVDEIVELDIDDATTLSDGNKSIVIYNVVSSNQDVCEIERIANGKYELKAISEGESTLVVTADYRGSIVTKNIHVNVGETNSIANIYGQNSDTFDVFTTTGIRILHNATADAVNSLASGIYIVNGKKIVIK